MVVSVRCSGACIICERRWQGDSLWEGGRGEYLSYAGVFTSDGEGSGATLLKLVALATEGQCSRRLSRSDIWATPSLALRSGTLLRGLALFEFFDHFPVAASSCQRRHYYSVTHVLSSQDNGNKVSAMEIRGFGHPRGEAQGRTNGESSRHAAVWVELWVSSEVRQGIVRIGS